MFLGIIHPSTQLADVNLAFIEIGMLRLSVFVCVCVCVCVDRLLKFPHVVNRGENRAGESVAEAAL